MSSPFSHLVDADARLTARGKNTPELSATIRALAAATCVQDVLALQSRYERVIATLSAEDALVVFTEVGASLCADATAAADRRTLAWRDDADAK